MKKSFINRAAAKFFAAGTAAALALVAAFNLLIYLYPRTAGWKDHAAAQWRRLPWHSQALLFTAALIIISAYAPSGIPSFLYSNY